jgi:hypothetical protein
MGIRRADFQDATRFESMYPSKIDLGRAVGAAQIFIERSTRKAFQVAEWADLYRTIENADVTESQWSEWLPLDP